MVLDPTINLCLSQLKLFHDIYRALLACIPKRRATIFILVIDRPWVDFEYRLYNLQIANYGRSVKGRASESLLCLEELDEGLGRDSVIILNGLLAGFLTDLVGQRLFRTSLTLFLAIVTVLGFT